jgi:hypothetical protein
MQTNLLCGSKNELAGLQWTINMQPIRIILAAAASENILVLIFCFFFSNGYTGIKRAIDWLTP